MIRASRVSETMAERGAPAGHATECGATLLHHFFERQVEARPQSPALALGDRSLTYLELENRANRLARMLRRRGAGRGSVVAILLKRSIESYVAILAVLKAG